MKICQLLQTSMSRTNPIESYSIMQYVIIHFGFNFYQSIFAIYVLYPSLIFTNIFPEITHKCESNLSLCTWLTILFGQNNQFP